MCQQPSCGQKQNPGTLGQALCEPQPSAMRACGLAPRPVQTPSTPSLVAELLGDRHQAYAILCKPADVDLKLELVACARYSTASKLRPEATDWN